MIYDTGGKNLGVGPMPLLEGKQTFKTKQNPLNTFSQYFTIPALQSFNLKAIMLLYHF